MASTPLDKADRVKFRKFRNEELKAAARYFMLASVDRDPGRSKVFRAMAETEMSHARHWSLLLGETPGTLKPQRPGAGLFTLNLMARLFGVARVLPLLLRGESGGARDYATVPAAAPLMDEERQHQAGLRKMARGGEPDASNPHPEGGFLRGEGGTLRAAVLGVNDGLVSNFSLVMGVAGGTDNASFIVLAGVAGLLAGAFSMAAGEYISMRSQRDVYESMIEREKAELAQWPQEEERELALIYQRKGLTESEAALVASRLMAEPRIALETKVREELGLDPNDLGAPWGAALYSMAAFAAGAIVPLLPFVLGMTGTAAVVTSASASGLALVLVGGGLAWFSGVNAGWGAVRMVLFGAAAAGVTFGVGKLVGVSLEG